MRKKSMQVNLLNDVDNRKRQPNVSMKKANKSVEGTQHRLANQYQYEKEKIANESVECRQQRLQTHHEYRKNIFSIVFYAAVSRGPLYISSCCDQLWYEHSVEVFKFNSVQINFISNTVLLMLKGRDFSILMQKNI